MSKYDELVKLCPNLYRRVKHIECGEGWYDIIAKLSSELEKWIIKYIQNNPDDYNPPMALQVKEKFGTLRFYVSSATEEIHKLISATEIESGKICEFCGVPGQRDKINYWVKTLCPECLNELKSKNNEVS